MANIGFLIREAKRIKGSITMGFREKSIQDFNDAEIPLKLTLKVDFENGRHNVDVSYSLGRQIKHCPSVTFLERSLGRQKGSVILEKHDFTSTDEKERTVSFDGNLTRFKRDEVLLNLELDLEQVTPKRDHEQQHPLESAAFPLPVSLSTA